jgi:hypothetical protein
VEMGGVEPPSRTARRQYPTCVVGVLCAGRGPHRQGPLPVSQTAFGGRALADWTTAPFLGDAQPRSRKGEVRMDALPRGQ